MKALARSEEGVSPVIGVILMVAITVVLAAIIAAFVFGMVVVAPPTPISSIRAMEARAATNAVVLIHEGGDTVSLKDVELRIVNRTLAGEVYTFTDASGVFKAGDRLTINVKDNAISRDGTSVVGVSVATEGLPSLIAGDILDVEIFHMPSKKLVVAIRGLSVF